MSSPSGARIARRALSILLAGALTLPIVSPAIAASQADGRHPGAERRKVIIDQDAFEGPNIQPILMLLQDPSVDVLGITTVSGDGWAPEETGQVLRMLELVGRTEVPVVEGAVFPLVNSKARTDRREGVYGALAYKGAWTDAWPAGSTIVRRAQHGPFALPPLREGDPRLKAYPGSAAEFLLAMTRKYPGQVSILAMGPLTNLALAQRLDPGFADRVKDVVIEGGEFFGKAIDNTHDEFGLQTTFSPRMSFNEYFDPEAAHVVLSTSWKHLALVTTDANAGINGTQALFDKATASAGASGHLVARYLKQTAQVGYPLWDEVAVAAWLDPTLVARKGRMAMDVDLMQGPNYGALLTWAAGKGPGLGEQDVDVVFGVDKPRMEALFVDLIGR